MTDIKNMSLLHYTNRETLVPKTVSQQEANRRNDKPKGLWVSVEGKCDWREWCDAEQFRDIDNQSCFEIVLKDDADILVLDTVEKIINFNNVFGDGTGGIRWEDVADIYQGVVIAPYQWDLRLSDSITWYYSWDCASGCIWDAQAIDLVTRREKEFEVEPKDIDFDAKVTLHLPSGMPEMRATKIDNNHRRMIPDTVTLVRTQGPWFGDTLTAEIEGPELKKDGSLGRRRQGIRYLIETDYASDIFNNDRYLRQDEVPHWLNKLIKEYAPGGLYYDE